MRTSLSAASVFWRTLMRYPSYLRNYGCAFPSSSPSITQCPQCSWPRMLILAPCAVGRKSKFFRLDGLLLLPIIMGLRCARASFAITRCLIEWFEGFYLLNYTVINK